uniref:Solute carrier family 22 member 4 n=1 Tax=Cacopsylla melanoneura TaxID=428564 RepID=A0A8D9A9U1_9HEMI
MTATKEPQVTLDTLLDDIGFQARNIFVLGLPILLVSAFSLTYIFTTAELKYRCLIPECEKVGNTTYLPPWLNNAVPYNKDGTPKTCYRYSTVSGTSGCNQASFFNVSDVQKCKAWVYRTDEVNILNEFDLQCDENKWKLPFVGSMDGIGALLGLPLCGFMSDRFGRRITLAIFSSGVIILGLLRSCSTSYEVFTFLDFCNAFLDSGIYSSAFVLGMELVSAKQRVSTNVILNLFYPAGDVMLGVIGMYVTNWRWFLRLLYGPGVIFFVYYWIVPESMRWLLTKNRTEEAVEIVDKIIQNHPNRDNLDLKHILSSSADSASKEDTFGYFKTLGLALKSWRLLYRVIHSSICWIGVVFLWYGVIQQSVSLTGNKHVNFIYSALAQIPGYLMTALALKVGHKITFIASIGLCSAVSFAFYFTAKEFAMFRMVLYILSNIGITSAYTVIYISTCEMFPTPLRSSLLAFCSMMGRIGQVFAPQVFLLGTELPFLIFGCVALLVGFLSSFLPETLNMELPNTVKQAEYVGLQGVDNPAQDNNMNETSPS